MSSEFYQIKIDRLDLMKIVKEVEAWWVIWNYFPLVMMNDESQKIFHQVFECMNLAML